MNSIVRALVVYATLFVVVRIAGKRTFNEMTTFDFVLLLIVSEAVQQTMIGSDNSITSAFLIVAMLVSLGVLLSVVKGRWRKVSCVLDPQPMLIVADGVLIKETTDEERVDEDDVLTAARFLYGLERMDQIKHTILEASRHISIIPHQ